MILVVDDERIISHSLQHVPGAEPGFQRIMALLPILRFPDERLRTVAKPVTVFDAALRQLVADMAETMYEAPGIGLAAKQRPAPAGVWPRALAVPGGVARLSLGPAAQRPRACCASA